MKITLHLNGSAAALAAFLATVPESLTVSSDTDTAPASTPVPPMPVLTPAEDSEDDGPVNTAAPATDSAGMPWDARIHASTKGTNEDGTWRKKRKVDATLVAAVEAELRGTAAPAPLPVAAPAAVPMPVAIPMAAAMPAPVAAAPAPAPVAMPAPVPAPVTPMPAPVAAVPMPAPAPVAAPAPAAAPAAEGIDFTGFMAHLTSKMQTSQITSDDLVSLVQQINAAWTPHGHAPLGAITDLQNDPAKLTYAVQVLQQNGKW